MRILVIILALVATGPAWAQYCSGQHQTQASRAEVIAKVEKMLAVNLGRIETVPPDVAAYLEKESAAAIEQSNRARFEMVASHPYYKAFEIETHYKIMRENLEAARTSRAIADQAVYLSVVLARYVDLSSAIHDYITFDHNRGPKRVLTKDDTQGIYVMLPSVKSNVLLALQCGVRELAKS
jgi:hypothetical protein